VESVIQKLPSSLASANHLQLKVNLQTSSLDSLKTNQLIKLCGAISTYHVDGDIAQAVPETDGLTNFNGQ